MAKTFGWSANLRAKRFRAPEGGYILSSLREERLGEKGGAFLNGKEGRVGFRKKPFLMVKKDGMILEILIFKNKR